MTAERQKTSNYWTESAARRRETLKRGALGAIALIAGPALVRPAAARAQTTSDEDLRDYLEEAIALEQIAARAYSDATGRTSPKREGDAIESELARIFERFNAHEDAHATAWRTAIDQLGFDAPPEPEAADDAEAFELLDDGRADEIADLLRGAERAEGQEEIVEALIAIEEALLRFYLDSAPGIDSEDLATTSAEIAGCAAQHLVVLREQRGDTPAEAADVG